MWCAGQEGSTSWQRNAAIAVFVLLNCGLAQADQLLDEQRQAFRAVYPAVERGEWQPVADHQSLLERYVLWPDLKAAWLRTQLQSADESEVLDFLERHSALRPGRDLRYRFALHLAEQERWPEYLDLYRRHYSGMKVAKLDCLAARAGILSGRQDEVVLLARDLWLVGRSQADECDPVFEYLRGAGLLEGDLMERRFELAVSAQQFSLARHLARSMDESYLERVNRWLKAANDAEGFLKSDTDCEDSDRHREQLIYALERVADGDALLAQEGWQRARARHRFAPDQAARISRYVALSAAQQHYPEARRLLGELAGLAVDANVRGWRVRSALLGRAWPEVIAVIRDMPAAEQRAQEWQYWLAVALQQTGRDRQALPIFRELASSRTWFGFLAADELGLDYAFEHTGTPANEATIAKLAQDPALVRARELYYVGLESRGRSEWNDAVGKLLPAELAQAAVLAHRWNWHSQAIATVADSGAYDDLEIRYPLPYAQAFREYSDAARIRGSWAYGVARSESLFMADIRSHAGAIGVMQLMPATGRRTASELNLPYSGLKTLTDPASNIRLGTKYLGKMLERFDRNVVLATAAYNAGPYKVEEWLPASEVDARIWIENIPYSETRSFVRRVLVSDAIFHWRLTGRITRLSAALEAIAPAAAPEQLTRTASTPANGS